MAQGAQILTLQGLAWAVKNRKAVVVPKSWVFGKPRPAAVIINLQGKLLLDLFEKGMYIYKKKERKYG